MANTRSKYENVSKLIDSYADDLVSFRDESTEQVKSLVVSIKNSERGWEGSGYEAFRDSVEEEADKILKAVADLTPEIERLENLSADFKKIEAIMSRFGK